MMRSPVGAIDHRIGRAHQLIVQTALDQAADDGIGRSFTMESEAAGVGYAATVAHRPVPGLDDVGADGEVAQRLFRAGPQRPDRRSLPAGQAPPFELAATADHQAAPFRIVAPTTPPIANPGPDSRPHL